MIRIVPEETIAFPAAENFRANVMKLSEENSLNVLIDCKHLKTIDVTVGKVSDPLHVLSQLIAVLYVRSDSTMPTCHRIANNAFNAFNAFNALS